MFSYQHYLEAVDYIQSKIAIQPTVGLILGSGLGGLAEKVTNSVIISYADIPHFPISSAPSHKGCLVVGEYMGNCIAVMQGRVHMYEGYTAAETAFPVRALSLLGIQNIIITNVAGAINRNYSVGDLMLIRDHINLPGLSGHDPLRGENILEFGSRFTDLSHAYDETLAKKALSVAKNENIPMHQGVYAFQSGPSFETPAEINMMARNGADAVGMSTVPEVIVANNAGVNVLAVSAITNIAVNEIESEQETNEEDVWASLSIIIPRITKVLSAIMENLSK